MLKIKNNESLISFLEELSTGSKLAAQLALENADVEKYYFFDGRKDAFDELVLDLKNKTMVIGIV